MQLSRYLGVTQKTAWFMLQRIRYAVEQYGNRTRTPDGQVTEVDETFIGGNKGNDRRGDKTVVAGAYRRASKKVIARVVEKADAKHLRKFVQDTLTKDGVLLTDESNAYKPLKREGYSHMTVNHTAGEYGRGLTHTNSIEGFWSHLKRGIDGIYHQISKKHTNKYVTEYVYRYNTRSYTDAERFEHWFRHIKAIRLTYKSLIS